jgi:hypothetical protein
MADGRDLIEEAYNIIKETSDALPNFKASFRAEAFAEFEGVVGSALKWVKLCRGKVWLRGHEGTALAQDCLEAAQHFKAALNDPSAAIEAVGDLSSQLEQLAKIIATKVQVLT